MFKAKLNRIKFLISLIISLLIFVVLSQIVNDWLSDISSIGRLAQNSFLQFILSVLYVILAIARLNDIGIARYWSVCLFLPWLCGLENMLLIDYFFNNSDGVNKIVTYIGVCLTIIAYVLLIFLIFKPQSSGIKMIDARSMDPDSKKSNSGDT